MFGLIDHAFVLVLLVFIYHQIGEHRLHVAVYVAVLHADLRIQGEAALCHIEAAIGAQQGVKRGHVGVFDGNVEVEFGTLAGGQKSTAYTGNATAHKLTDERQLRRPLRLVVTQVPNLQIGIGDEEFKGRIAGLVVEHKNAAFNVEFLDFNIDRTLIRLFFNSLTRELNTLCLEVSGLGPVDIRYFNRIEGHVVNVDIGYPRGIFDEPVAGECASRDDDVDMVTGSRHGIHGHV